MDLVRIDPSRNMRRRYEVVTTMTLFGPAVQINWGRLGSPGRERFDLFDTIGEAEVARAKLLAKKLRRGYQVRRS